jgi:hypothetical protein
MYSFAIHRTLATDASLHPRIHPPRTNHESSAAAGVPTSVRPHISHTHEKKNPNPPSFQSRRLLFRFEPTGPSWDVIDGSRTANHKGTRPLSFLSKKRTRRERRDRQKKTRSISGGPFFKVRKRSKNARTTSSSSSRDSTTLGRARGRPLPGRPLDDAPPRPRLDDVGLSLSRISCVPSAADREMRCDAMRPDFARRNDDEEGASQSQSREARVALVSLAVCFSSFHSFREQRGRFAIDEDTDGRMRRMRRMRREHVAVRPLTNARAREGSSVVRIIQRLVHRTCAPLGERLENRPTSRRDL